MGNTEKIFYKSVPERRREIKLILLCARPRLDDAAIKEITDLADKTIDWVYLVRTAYLHNLHILLYRSLKKACPESVPNDVLVKLEREYTTNSMRSLLITGKLVSILKLLQDNNIPAIPFKGPVLAEMAYGYLALRQFGDLDILVDRENALKAVKIFEAHGFRPEINLNQKQLSAYAAKKSSIELISSISGLRVDLHWEMSGAYTFYPLSLNCIKNHLVHGTIAGRNVRQPCREDLLVCLCLHGARDCWGRLESLSALAGLIQSQDGLDWMRVRQLAKRMRCERILHLGLFLVCDLFDVVLPEDVMKLVEKDVTLPGLALTVYNNFFAEDNGSPAFKVNPKFSIFHFRVRDRWSEKIRYGKHLVLDATTQEWTHFPVPAKLSFVHSILRPARLSVAFLAGKRDNRI